MTKIANWAALAAMGLVAAACTITTSDDLDGGGAAGASGSAGSAGSDAASVGSDAGADAVATTTVEAGSEAAAVVPGKCETCLSSTAGKCKAEVDACRGNTGCAAALPGFYACLSQATTGDPAQECATDFFSAAGSNDSTSAGAGLANDLGSCAMDSPCVTGTCRGTDGG